MLRADLPVFTIEPSVRGVLLRVAPDENYPPEVMFALFAELVLRLYNVASPKHLNMHLEHRGVDRWARTVRADDAHLDVRGKMEGLVSELQAKLALLEGVSQRQLEAALDHARACAY